MSGSDRKLCRKRGGKILGVCLGFADFFNLDVTLIRIIWVFFGFVGAGVLAYIIAAIVMPQE